MSTATSIAVVLAVLFAATDAYSKYGRTCKDIACRPDETCVISEEPCNENSCRFPTCERTSHSGESCRSKLCPSGQFCRTENGKATCVDTVPGLAPAARRPPGYVRPTQRPWMPPPSTPAPVRTPPPPPPRSSSFGGGGRFSGHSGDRNSIGSGSIWDRLFGGDRTKGAPPGGGGIGGGGGSGGRGYDRWTTPRPATNYHPGGNGYYNTHTATDSKGNRVWTFSG